jgi:PAS domain S-box-containing protein
MSVGAPATRGRKSSVRAARILLIGYFVVLVVIVASTVPALIGTLQTLNRQQAVYDTADAAASQVLVGALNQETGIRGYALSGEQSFLQPYQSGSSQYAQAMRQLRGIDLGPTFRDQVRSTARAFEAWHTLAAAAVADVRNHDTAAALTATRQAERKARFDQFRRHQVALAATIRSRLRASRTSLHNQVERSLVALGVATVFGVLIGIGMWLWWRISGRRTAEQERELADRALLMQAAIDASSDSLYAKDLDRRHTLANRARAAALTGDPDADLIGHTVDEFVSKDVAADIHRNEQQVMDTGSERQFQEVLPQADGPHIFSIRKSPLRNTTGELSGIVGVARDVTREMELLAARERLYQIEHSLAETLQLSMLGTDRIDDPRVEACARYHPATDEMSVGGDWYDILPTPDGRVALIVGDAVGHGLDSATAMGQLRSALAALVNVGADPSVTLEALDQFAAGLPRAQSATCLVAHIDPEAEELEYSCAGHLPPIIARPGCRPEVLAFTQDPPLAVRRSRPRRTTTVPFPVGSVVVLYTDGLVERRGELIDVGLGGLVTLIDRLGDVSMDDLCETVMGQPIEAALWQDDVAMISARLVDPLRRESPPRTMDGFSAGLPDADSAPDRTPPEGVLSISDP